VNGCVTDSIGVDPVAHNIEFRGRISIQRYKAFHILHPSKVVDKTIPYKFARSLVLHDPARIREAFVPKSLREFKNSI